MRLSVRTGHFSPLNTVHTDSGSHWALTSGTKQPEREADHSPPSSVEDKNEWRYNSTLPCGFMACIGSSGLRTFCALIFHCFFSFPPPADWLLNSSICSNWRSTNTQQFYVLPTQCICVFCVDLRTNSDYFTVQHWVVGFYNWDGVCLLRGTFCPHNVFMCFVWIWEQTTIISLYGINWLVGVYNWDGVCLLRGTDWVFKFNWY